MPTKVYLPNKKCKNCGKEFGRESCNRISDYREKQFCSRECFHFWCAGENHSNYIDGTKHRPDGYIRDSKDRYIHRLIMEEFLGRPLEPNEQVHHIDGNTSNNALDNLKLYASNSEHRKYEVTFQERGEDGRFTK